MSEFLEPAGASKSAKEKEELDEYFIAHIDSVTFKSSVKVKLEKAVIEAPHWTHDEAEKGQIEQDWSEKKSKLKLSRSLFSKKPAAHAISAGDLTIEAKIKITKSKRVEPNGKVKAFLGGEEYEVKNPTPTAEGEQTVTLSIPKGNKLSYFIGSIIWTMGVNTPKGPRFRDLGETWVELYFILDTPAKTMFNQGLFAEVLRFLFTRVGVGGLKFAISACRKITSYCHTEHGLFYNIDRGARKYDAQQFGAYRFPLTDYMHVTSRFANCYDQAAAVQSLGCAVGVPVGWFIMMPYGYIKPTLLLGWGLCNNPIWKKEFGLYVPFLIDPHDKRRSDFGNHAFNHLGYRILDACAGPHLGSENFKQYVANAIDDDMDPRPLKIRRHDREKGDGVKNVQ